MEFSQMDVGVERSAAPQSSHEISVEVLNRGGEKEIIGAVSVEVVVQERNDTVCKRVAVVESSSDWGGIGVYPRDELCQLGWKKVCHLRHLGGRYPGYGCP
jgi:hypothetical protein